MLELRELTVHDEPEAMQAHAELRAEGFGFLWSHRPGEAWIDYVTRLQADRLGEGLTGDRVPATLLVADVDGEIVGRASIRHALNSALTQVGGHIGYGVRPAFRCRGYATEILRQSLTMLRGMGVEQALVTCDDAAASSTTGSEPQTGC